MDYFYINVLILLLFISTSCYFYVKSSMKIALFFLFLTALLLRFYFVVTDDFLHDWDERFHAVVAKNVMNNPFKPMLRANPIIDYNYTDWCCNHVWLHKQPLFLWQMALSMKIFGVNLFALRLPSALMGALLIFPTYKIGKLIFNPTIGYFAAFLLCFAQYQIELISGAMGMDHNDMAFLFYVTLSIWAFFEYYQSLSLKWVLLIGLFSGMAILCKWLTGLLVYLGWVIYLLANWQNKSFRHFIKDFFLAISTTIIVALPWQIYIDRAFPLESAHERAFNWKHIFENIEGHKGSIFYYLLKMDFHYGNYVYLLLVLGILIILKNCSLRQLLLMIYVATIYFFFSIIVKSKLPSYVYVISPLVYLIIGLAIYHISRIKAIYQSIISLSLLFIVAIITLQPMRLYENHLKANVETEIERHNTAIYQELNDLVPSDYVVFNCKEFDDTEAMFYSNRNVYQWYLNEEEYHKLKTKGQKIAVFRKTANQPLPKNLLEDKEILVIDRELK